MSLLIVGSVALDTIETPAGRADRALGGSASYAALASRLFAPTAILGVVGEDFPLEYVALLHGAGIDTAGLETVPGGKTFHWAGRYHPNMNARDTLLTEINVLGTHHPAVPEPLRGSDFLFLANTSPELQLRTLSEMRRPRLVLADTMNLWIETQREAVWRLIAQTDVMLINESEAQMLCDTASLVRAGRLMLEGGAKRVIIKKGEHGCLMLTRETLFTAPAFPLETVCDPTGAGDSFAGAYLGFLAQAGSLEEPAHRAAIAAATALASYNCEEFGVGRLARLTREEVTARAEALREMTRFDGAGPA